MPYIYIDILGVIGSIAISISLIPQTYGTIRNINKSESVSIYFLILIFIASICQLIYSIEYNVLPMIIANWSVLINTIILISIYLIRNKYTSDTILNDQTIDDEIV